MNWGCALFGHDLVWVLPDCLGTEKGTARVGFFRCSRCGFVPPREAL